MLENKETNSYRHIMKYTSVFGGVQCLNLLASLVRGKVLAELLGATGMGVSTIYTSALNFLSESTNLGIPTSAVRSVSDAYEHTSHEALQHHVQVVRAWTWAAALLGALVCLMSSPLLSQTTFRDSRHVLHFILLSPAVALTIINGGETAILKGARCLKPLATIQVFTVVAALFICVPIYYFFGFRGVVPVIVLTALMQLATTLRYSLCLFPLQLRGLHTSLAEGTPMVKLGLAFLVTGFFGKGAELLVRSILNVSEGLSAVGLFNAGYAIAVSYAAMIFVAMDTDYFPRISACVNDLTKQNSTVNHQIEVSILMAAPLLLALMLLMPLLVPLLLTNEFSAAVSMAQVAVLAMYLKAVTLPMSYLPLAKAHSRVFIVMELVCDFALVFSIWIGHRLWGLYGTGVGIVLVHLIDLLMIGGYACWHYHFRPSVKSVSHFSLQMLIALLAYVTIVASPSVWVYSALGGLLFVASAVYSLRTLLNLKRHA